MNKPVFDLLTNIRNSQGQTVLFGKIIAILMMTSFAVAVVQIGERLAPDWRGEYLVWTSLVIGIEAMVTRGHAKVLEGRERIIFLVSEWIAIAVALKILLYLVHGPAQLLTDLPLWQENFLQNFFTGEYLLAILVAGLVWLNSIGFAGELEDLYDRDMDTRWDELGKLQNAIHDVRRRMITRIFVMGTLVVTMAAISRVDTSAIFRPFGKPPSGYYAPVVNALVYFVMALVLLSQTQFALLRIRWLWQQMPISPNLTKNWIRYALAFFVFLGLLVVFLPTEYSIGLFDTLRYVVNFVMRIATFLLMLIAIPFTLCMSLFRFSNSTTPLQPAQQPTPPFVPSPAQPIAWLEIIRSLAFWIIFLGVIFFALRYFLSQNQALWQAILRFPLFRWISAAWDGFWKWLRGANQQIAGLVKTGIKRLRAQRTAVPTQVIRRLFNIARLNPREKIIYYYINLVETGGEQGLVRKPAQTPYQYENRLRGAMPEVEQELHGLTDTFIEARYSQHPVEQTNADQASSLWERIKAALLNFKR